MLVAAIQTDVIFADVAENLNRVNDWLVRAAAERVDLAVFPECALSGYAFDDRSSAVAQAIATDGSMADELAAMSETHAIRFSIGVLERHGGKLFNASLLFGDGKLEGHYRKVHLPRLGVDRFVDRGDLGYPVFETPAARIGLAICYDCSFPEPMRILGLAGADVIALGTNWPIAAYRTAEVVPPARSMENHLFFVAANRVGSENGFTYAGRSSICGPDGVVLASVDDDREIMLTARIDPAEARNKTIERTPGAHVIDRFADRQPDQYGPICRSQPVRPAATSGEA